MTGSERSGWHPLIVIGFVAGLVVAGWFMRDQSRAQPCEGEFCPPPERCTTCVPPRPPTDCDSEQCGQRFPPITMRPTVRPQGGGEGAAPTPVRRHPRFPERRPASPGGGGSTPGPTVAPTIAPPATPAGIPGLTTDRPSIEPGGIVRALGHGCVPSSPVELFVNGIPAGNATSGADGGFAAPLSVPPLTPGRYEVSARCGALLAAPLDVVVSTAQQGGASSLALLLFFIMLGAALFRGQR